jgi:hypothetical protein
VNIMRVWLGNGVPDGKRWWKCYGMNDTMAMDCKNGGRWQLLFFTRDFKGIRGSENVVHC